MKKRHQYQKSLRETELALESEKLSRWTPDRVIIQTVLVLAFFFLAFASYFSYNMFNTLNRVSSIETVSDGVKMVSEANNGSNININNSANRG